ncbi:MAG: SDR family NAD(P)-dependent oxidoreductase [Pseudomonadota bacterium]
MSKGLALITGASAGIGEALAREFAARGFDLVITARRQEKLEALADELGAQVSVTVIQSNLASEAGALSLISQVEQAGLHVDVLVNNAGIAYTGKFVDLEPDEIEGLIGLNMTTLTLLTHHFARGMVARGSGRILNVASVAGFQPVPSMSLYAASKAFVISLTEGMSEELRGTGVSITALCPGLTNTEMALALEADEVPPFLMSSPAEVAREGYESLMNREVIRIPGVANQAAVTWARFQPRWVVRGLGGLFARLNPGAR